MHLRIRCLCIDTTEPARFAGFWQAALGRRRTHESDEEVALEPPVGSREDAVVPDLLFLRVPEEKVGKNRGTPCRFDRDTRHAGISITNREQTSPTSGNTCRPGICV